MGLGMARAGGRGKESHGATSYVMKLNRIVYFKKVSSLKFALTGELRSAQKTAPRCKIGLPRQSEDIFRDIVPDPVVQLVQQVSSL